VFDEWLPLNVTPPVFPAEPETEAHGPFDPTSVVLNRPPRSVAPRLIEILNWSADAVVKLVAEEARFAEVAEATTGALSTTPLIGRRRGTAMNRSSLSSVDVTATSTEQLPKVVDWMTA